MKKSLKAMFVMLMAALMLAVIAIPAFADVEAPAPDAAVEQTDAVLLSAAPDEAKDIAAPAEADAAEAEKESPLENLKSVKAIIAGIVIAVVASVGAVSMALSITKSADGIARQPEAAGNIRTSLMLGLVFIETAIIYALIVAILVIFVL